MKNTNIDEAPVATASSITYSAPIRELTDAEYPENPDISIRHKLDGTFSHNKVELVHHTKSFYGVTIYPNNDKSDTIILPRINIYEWIPSVPDTVKSDQYLAEIGLINQEWNRQQVKLRGTQFEVKGKNQEKKVLVRVDFARNCLNAYLWEIIGYALNEEGKEAPVYHGWFNFPSDLYTKLYFERNNMKFEDLQDYLVTWKDPESKPIQTSLLRNVVEEEEISFSVINHELYPLVGERKKKNRNVIYPKNATRIRDFLTDSTQFATFSPPGYYTTDEPRKTELGRLLEIEKIVEREVKSTYGTSGQELKEFEIFYSDREGLRKTRLVIGGLNMKKIPQLSVENAHKGFQMPMGIANHSFYETFEEMNGNPSKENPYYAFLLDEKGNWLDSHKIGIDGPLFHFDEEGSLHLWLLSFERHAFVGHYLIETKP
ncbi:MAG: hypothetical protein GY827_03505 [Cytophagales bacterium]|nr:hypothetical protein [Cytophagales bacterium]